jgi:hypothetical protein
MLRANVRSLDQNDDLRLSNYDLLIQSRKILGDAGMDGSLNAYVAPEEITLTIIESPVTDIPPRHIWRLDGCQVHCPLP